MEVKIEKTKTSIQHEAAVTLAEFQTKVDLGKSEEDNGKPRFS